jgi:hypothetical protein
MLRDRIRSVPEEIALDMHPALPVQVDAVVVFQVIVIKDKDIAIPAARVTGIGPIPEIVMENDIQLIHFIGVFFSVIDQHCFVVV